MQTSSVWNVQTSISVKPWFVSHVIQLSVSATSNFTGAHPPLITSTGILMVDISPSEEFKSVYMLSQLILTQVNTRWVASWNDSWNLQSWHLLLAVSEFSRVLFPRDALQESGWEIRSFAEAAFNNYSSRATGNFRYVTNRLETFTQYSKTSWIRFPKNTNKTNERSKRLLINTWIKHASSRNCK